MIHRWRLLVTCPPCLSQYLGSAQLMGELDQSSFESLHCLGAS